MTKQTHAIDTSLLESIMILRGYKKRGDFAEALKVNPTTISNLLNGKHQPSGVLINAIYKQLDLTPEQVVEIFFPKEEQK